MINQYQFDSDLARATAARIVQACLAAGRPERIEAYLLDGWNDIDVKHDLAAMPARRSAPRASVESEPAPAAEPARPSPAPDRWQQVFRPSQRIARAEWTALHQAAQQRFAGERYPEATPVRVVPC